MLKKFITILILGAALILPMVVSAAACPNDENACQVGVTEQCVCDTEIAEVDEFCWAAGNEVFNTKAGCDTAMSEGDGEGDGDGEILPKGLAGCTMKHEIKGCTRNTRIEGGATTDCTEDAAGCGSEICCLLDKVYTIADWIFVILLVVAGLFVIWSAFDFVLSKGEPEKITSGRNKLTWALVGVIIAFISQGLVRVIVQIIS